MPTLRAKQEAWYWFRRGFLASNLSWNGEFPFAWSKKYPLDFNKLEVELLNKFNEVWKVSKKLLLTPGVYGPGAWGHQATREVCAKLIRKLTQRMAKGASPKLIAQALMVDWNDQPDYQDYELAACEWLNKNVPVEHHSWGWTSDGDFGLWDAR